MSAYGANGEDERVEEVLEELVAALATRTTPTNKRTRLARLLLRVWLSWVWSAAHQKAQIAHNAKRVEDSLQHLHTPHHSLMRIH